MAATPEDQRTAATIAVSLSSCVMTASLGVIAAQVAVATFILDKRDHLLFFAVWAVLSGGVSVWSVLLGGDGIWRLTWRGFSGYWSLDGDGGFFNRQALTCLAGMLFLVLSVFCGTSKSSPAPADINALQAMLASQGAEIQALKAENAEITRRIGAIAGTADARSRRQPNQP